MSEPRAGLHTTSLTVRYGGVVANADISLSVEPGQVVGLIGPNGAGKTTFVDAVTGFTACTGSVELDGQSLDGLPPHRRRALGLTRTWQSGELFGNLTVAENILVAARPGGAGALWRDVFGRRDAAGKAVVGRALDAVGLTGVAGTLARDLTLGQQKLVGVARALAGTCRLLLLDEPAAGLDSNESLEFAERVRSIAAQGPGVLLIDHDMSLVLGVCDVVCVLEFGKPIFTGPPAVARTDPAVVAAYLGAPMETVDA
ncbi:ABC transporter ATP-binding protein [Geodermatophilus nigrescens]|uniref:Amino acid/amide ABC transporter ATP-binding protein 1, HAAT family n=1 Tax=Geodermatophilus nigrescens TaxID=1070870 RepID=A0A1M5LNP2_9ACTN|nr:ABC transporter ATP-binding protein [Geodermatophilus nigrescens]SHG66762.1 amino acid/amide ABC transporter ATP-binding protein 1, HAAT family [Geodermatophilus nigrescens]